ncbi:MAG: serine/threonine protein kinase [Planctomycetes bacterium]|nr:serine/threonine protein kinase [Planctomycetota bacterium]
MTKTDRDPQDDSLVELDPSQAEAFLERTRTVSDGEPSPPSIPGFEVLGVLGRGATGVVYRARQEAVEREVALKALHPELVTNVRAVKRLKREARLAARLAHPSIISAIDMGEVNGVWWYAMELVEGVSLGRRIAERGSLTEREVLRLFSPLCDALQHAHEVGVVHRDIKPANILIDGRGRALLVDLGLAVGQNDPAITRTGATLGTPHYISPEQARDPGQADIRSDIWSIGATMYHAVCGRPPFKADGDGTDGVAEVLARVLHDPVEDPRAIIPGLSRDLSLLLRKCLTRDPAQRYQEPWELVADIELLRERRRLDLRGSRLDPYASRRPRWLGGALVAAVGAAAVALTWVMTARPWEDPVEEVAPRYGEVLEDWPELLAIRDGFESSSMTLAAALADLGAQRPEEVPGSGRILRDQLLVRLKGALAEDVSRCLSGAQSEVQGALQEHAFDRAARACGDGLDERLRQATGFASLDRLPAGAARLEAEHWRRSRSEQVQAERRLAREAAAAALRLAYPDLVRSRIAGLLKSRRWAEADAFLDRADSEGWLELEGLELDLRGLDASERLEVASEVDALARSDRSNVRYRMAAAVDEVTDFIDAERQAALDEIQAGRVKGERSVVDSFNDALAAKSATLGLDVGQLTAEFRAPFVSEVNEVRAALSVAEAVRREELAELALLELEEDLGPLRKRRDYAAVRQALNGALAEPWRKSTHAAIRARVRETELLDMVLDRAAQGIEARAGQTVEVHFERIPVRGRVGARASSARRLGFQLTAGRDQRIPVFLSPSQRTGAPAERVLEGADVLRFAGLLDPDRLSPVDQLAAAAFLAAEGDAEAARRRIRLQDHPSDELLPADLERRVRRFAEERPDRRGTTSGPPDRGEAAPGLAPLPGVEQVFGVPNQASVGRQVRLVWDMVEDGSSTRELGVARPLPRGRERIGAWSPGRWALRPEGLALLAELEERSDFTGTSRGPHLALLAPLNLEKPVLIRLRVRPGDHRPEGHLVAVSVRGYHLLLACDPFQPRAWFGSGDLGALLRHVEDGAAELPGTFLERPFKGLTDGEEATIELELGPSSLERAIVNGEVLDFPRFLDKAAAAEDVVRLRSAKPMTLLDAEVRGTRRARR